jgi:parallel beta-helix repeat protein
MKNYSRLFILLLIPMSIICLLLFWNNSNQSTVAGKTYYLVITNSDDAIIEIYNALEACRKGRYSRLVIAQGVYNLRRTRAFEKYVAVSNCDNGLKRIAFPLDGFRDFEIDGSGSLFICHGKMLIFELENTKNILLKNFSVDWEKPFYLQAQVVDVNRTANSFDIEVYEECDVKIVNNELLFYDSNMLRAEDQWLQDINWSEWFDPTTGGVVYRSHIYKPRSDSPGFRVSQIAERTYRLQNATRNLPEPGWILICKGIRNNNTTNRSSSVIHINRSENIRVEDVIIHTASGIGFVAERSKDIFIDRMRVALPVNSGRMVTTTADATHFVNCRGRIEIRDSYFENVLDDITNIHGNYASILDVIDSHTFGVESTHQHQLDVEIAGPGDTMRIVDENFLPVATRIVRSVDFRNSVYTVIRFDEEIESLVNQGGHWVENLTWNAQYFLFTNSVIKNNRGRGVCVSNSGEVIIENNTFINNSMSAVRLTGDLRIWYTSSPVDDVLIRNNKIISHTHYPVFLLAPYIPCESEPVEYYNQNVRITGNQIESSVSPILHASHIDGLVFSNNKILPLKGADEHPADDYAFKLNCVQNVQLINNISERISPLKIDKDQFSGKITVDTQ